jgi:hypothetical protein
MNGRTNFLFEEILVRCLIKQRRETIRRRRFGRAQLEKSVLDLLINVSFALFILCATLTMQTRGAHWYHHMV